MHNIGVVVACKVDNFGIVLQAFGEDDGLVRRGRNLGRDADEGALIELARHGQDLVLAEINVAGLHRPRPVAGDVDFA